MLWVASVKILEANGRAPSTPWTGITGCSINQTMPNFPESSVNAFFPDQKTCHMTESY